MGSEWRERSLDEVVSLQRGHDLPEPQRKPGDIPIIGSFGGVTGYHNEFKAVGPGVTIGRSGASFGAVGFVKEDYWPLNTALYVTDFKGNHPYFIYYLLKQINFSGFNSGSAQPSLNRNYIAGHLVRIPSREDQNKIAAILSAFDDKIELNRQMNRTLEQMARAMFKSWFVDFDPVRARMRGEVPEGMDAEMAEMFPEELEEVEGREVPRGWRITPFDSGLTIFGGGTPRTSSPEFWNGEIPWYSVVDVPDDGDIWVVQTEKTITQAGLEGSSTRLLPAGTTIISARGTVGKLALTSAPMAMNQSCYGLFPRDQYSVNFTYFSTFVAVEELKRRTHGAVFDTITRDTIRSINSVDPDKSISNIFEVRANILLQAILSNIHESKHLEQLRDALLPNLISGEMVLSNE